MVFEESKLQDVQARIRMWKSNSLLDRIDQFLYNPLACFSQVERKRILEELAFEEKQLKEKIKEKIAFLESRDSDLVFDDRRINVTLNKIKIPSYLKNRGGAWIIKNRVRRNKKRKSN